MVGEGASVLVARAFEASGVGGDATGALPRFLEIYDAILPGTTATIPRRARDDPFPGTARIPRRAHQQARRGDPKDPGGSRSRAVLRRRHRRRRTVPPQAASGRPAPADRDRGRRRPPTPGWSATRPSISGPPTRQGHAPASSATVSATPSSTTRPSSEARCSSTTRPRSWALRGGGDVQLERSGWSGDGDFTMRLVEALQAIEEVAYLRVEDAPASRAGTGFNLLANELFVSFAAERRPRVERWLRVIPRTRLVDVPRLTLAGLELPPRGRGGNRRARLLGRRDAPVSSDRANHPALPDARLQTGGAGADLRRRRGAAIRVTARFPSPAPAGRPTHRG